MSIRSLTKQIDKSEHPGLFLAILGVWRTEHEAVLLPHIVAQLSAPHAMNYVHNYFAAAAATGDDKLVPEAVAHLKNGIASGVISEERAAYLKDRLPQLVEML